jgi:hypothetical protein
MNLFCSNAVEEYGHWSSNMSTAAAELQHAGQARRSALVKVQQAKIGLRLRQKVVGLCR